MLKFSKTATPKLQSLGCLVLALVNYSVNAEDLLAIYQQALAADPQLKAAQLNSEIGNEQKGQALGEMLPQVSAVANWSTNQQRIDRGASATNSSYPGTRYYVSLNQTLIDFGKFWNWRKASKLEDQYTAKAVEAEHELIYKVVDRYFAVLEAEDQLAFIRGAKQATERQHEQINKQYARQMQKVTDVLEVEARVDQLAADEIQADSERIVAQQALKELTGSGYGSLSPLRTDIVYRPLEGNLLDWLEVAKSQNPAIAAFNLGIEAAEDYVVTQKSKHLPVVDLQMNYYDTNTGYQSSNLGSNAETQVAAINVNVPIFSGGVTTHQVNEAQHRLQLSKNQHETALRALTKETSEAFLGANTSVRQIQAAQKALESASKSLQASEKGFNYGTVTLSDVLKAQQDEYQAKQDLAKAKYAYIKNRIRFMWALGSVSEENVHEVNDWLIKAGNRSDPIVTLTEAAQNGDKEAAYKLAVSYLEGSAGQKNDFKAADWMSIAARNGWPEAQYRLGLMNLNGVGVPKNKSQATAWLQKAAAAGVSDAAKLLAEQNGTKPVPPAFVPLPVIPVTTPVPATIVANSGSPQPVAVMKSEPKPAQAIMPSPPPPPQAQIPSQPTTLSSLSQVATALPASIKSLPPGYGLQFVASLDREEINKLIKVYSGSLVLKLYRKQVNDQQWYVLLQCCFDSRTQANQALTKLPKQLRAKQPFIVATEGVTLEESGKFSH